jgi:radical SAM superfamily enzyme YgiQ (UPF0313 family)
LADNVEHMALRVLLVNPPIFDFSAYDFWLKPYGLLRVAGMLPDGIDVELFDYLDRLHPAASKSGRENEWGRGSFDSRVVNTPLAVQGMPRRYRRYGIDRDVFRRFLRERGPFDVALIQTVMTYWYPGVREVLEDLRELAPGTRTVLGGVYATLCPTHARGLGADLVVEGSRLGPLWDFLGIQPGDGRPRWDLYPRLEVGILKLAIGCPFRCTYCSVPQVEPIFRGYPVERSVAELERLVSLGVGNVAFYDDALLYRPMDVLIPFLEAVINRDIGVAFHTPNALNARFITPELAELMVRAGFQTFFLGFESKAYEWQRKTGGKVYGHELERAVAALRAAGANCQGLTAYLIIGHPAGNMQDVEASMKFAHELGLRVMLSEFSPIPGTPDGEACRSLIDLDEPLCHNKTFFAAKRLGYAEVERLKALCRELNRRERRVESRGQAEPVLGP